MIKAAARTDMVMTDFGISDGAASPVKSGATKRHINIGVMSKIHYGNHNIMEPNYKKIQDGCHVELHFQIKSYGLELSRFMLLN